MKTKIVFLIGSIIALFLLGGCEKEESIFDENQNLIDVIDDERPESLGQYVPEDDEFFKETVVQDISDFDSIQVLKTGDLIYNLITNAVSALSIPTYAFRCYDNYKWAYRHVRQPDGSSCSWTSYVICTGNMAAVAGRIYPVDVDQVYEVKDGCGGSKSVIALRDYANSVDRNYVRARTIGLRKSTSDYLDVFKQMFLLMYVNKSPFVTIAMSGRYTHYVTVYSIYWKKGVVGSKIYFTDSLDPDRGSFDANIKYMDLWDFYCAMRNNSNSYYNFLELLPR